MSDFHPPKSQGILAGVIARTTRRAIIPPTESGERPEIVEFENWPGVTFTETGLVFGDSLDEQTWRKLGAWLGSLNRKTRLWIADWADESRKRGWGYTYDDLIAITGLKRETLYNYASIGRRVPIQNRIAGPNTGLYEAVACLSYNDQVPLLRRAIEGGWDRDRMRDAVQEFKGGAEPTEDPPFREEMADIANLTPALGFEDKQGDTTIFKLSVPDELAWSDDYYGALREILPDDVQAGEVWEITARRTK